MDNIKSLHASKCPHCNGDMFIEFEMNAPSVVSVITPEDILRAKADAEAKIRLLKDISPEDMQDAINWLRDENTVFGPRDVDSVVDSVVISSKKE